MDHSHGMAASLRSISAPQSRSFTGMFGRMFRELPAWDPGGKDDAENIEAIEGIAAQMVETAGDVQKGDIPDFPAGYTFFGQFIDHDLTFDPRSSLQRDNDPDNLEDFRSPSFDLDCVYGRGPDDQPYLFSSASGRKKFLLGTGDKDLPRIDDTAIIGDMRNDENLLISQMQLAFLKFHNEVYDNISGNKSFADPFAEAQRIVRWHYQWVVIHDWLTRLCGKKLVNDLLTGSGCPGKPRLCYYSYRDYPFMPVEFSVAAYRLPHSTMRAEYKINNTVPPLQLFLPQGQMGPDLKGFQPVPANHVVEWCHLLEFSGKPKPQAMRKIDKLLCAPVIHLPDKIAPEAPVPSPIKPPVPNDIGRSLAFRNLLRGFRFGLPSGQSIARRIGAEKILPGDTPLWRYMLDEAEAHEDGNRLGEVGARITAETFVGLLAADPSSYYSTYPGWTPKLETALKIPSETDDFQLRDIIKFAGAPI